MPNTLSTSFVAAVIAAADAQLAFAATSTVSQYASEPHAMPPFVCEGSLLYDISQQFFPDACSV